jgi:hypothetical protein
MKPQATPIPVIPPKHRARLTEEAVLQIFACRHDKRSPTVLSNFYGVNEKTVRDIWSGRTWSKETQHLGPARAVSAAVSSKQIGWSSGQDKNVESLGPTNDQARYGAITTTTSKTRFWMASPNGSISRSMASKVQDEDQPVASRAISISTSHAISIDEQLYEWERQGFWFIWSLLRDKS